MLFLSSTISSRFSPKNNQLRTLSNPRTQATIQDGRVTVQNVHRRQFRVMWLTREIVKLWKQGLLTLLEMQMQINQGQLGVIIARVKEKMLLAQAQEAGVVLHEDQQDFLADILEEMDSDCNDLQLHTTSNFKADHIDAYDSDCDDEATSCAIFMASFSPAGSINSDIVGPYYNSNILSEVPHYDTYQENDMLNSVVQETEYTEHLVSNNDSYDELMSDNNVISYSDYMVTIENDVAQYVPLPEQNNGMILSVIEQMQSQVEKCNTANQEAKCVNESLFSELEQYKEKVKVLEERQNSKEFFTKREEHLDS
ncbi:hypothetical protein Tco_1322368 [Tanacetum coccineum]